MFSIVENGGITSGSLQQEAAPNAGKKSKAEAGFAGTTKSEQSQAPRMPTRARYPVNLLESEIGEEVSELLSHPSLQLTSGHQAWLLMAIMYLVERERRKVMHKSGGVDQVLAMARAEHA